MTAHALAMPHVPVELHVSTPLPEHWDWPGPHTPVQVPPTHVVLALHEDDDAS